MFPASSLSNHDGNKSFIALVPPLDGEKLDPLSRLDVESREVLGHHGGDVVAQDVGVPDNSRVVNNLGPIL